MLQINILKFVAGHATIFQQHDQHSFIFETSPNTKLKGKMRGT